VRVTKSGSEFSTSYFLIFFVFNELRWEVVVHFVDISRIDDLHYLICRFITVECDQIYKTFKYTLEKPKGQSRMDNPEIVATLGTQNTGRTNKTKHRTEKQNKTQGGQTKQNTGVCPSCVLCTQCCHYLWIVHSWLPLRFL
jgi:hypothetical protein